MLSGQFPWRQKAAERRCLLLMFVAIDDGLAWPGTGTAASSNSAFEATSGLTFVVAQSPQWQTDITAEF